MRPINVLDLRDTYEIGGPGKTILETYRAIDASRFRLFLGVFLAAGEREDTPFVTAARSLGMPVHFIRGRHQYDPRLVTRLATLVEQLEIDIVHAHEVKSDVIAYASSWLRRVHTVTTLHGWIANSRKQRLLTALDKRLVGRLDLVMAVSQPIEQAVLAAGAPRDRVRLLHNGIVMDNFRRTGARGFLQAVTGRPLPGPILVSIGRLSAEKGHADLVHALAEVAGRGLPFSAVLIGDGPQKGPLEALIASLGLQERLHLPGYVADPARILEDADLMVLPSHTEGLPNAALEALAMEVPVVATRVGGTPEVVVDGVTGRLVPAGNPAALAAALGEFLRSPEAWKATARRGRAHVEEHFTFAGRTARLEQIYGDLVAAGAQP